MYTYTHSHMCTHTCAHTCTSYVHVCTHTLHIQAPCSMHAHMWTHMHTTCICSMHAYMNTHKHAYCNTRTMWHTCTHTPIHMYAHYTYVQHACTHIYILMCTHILLSLLLSMESGPGDVEGGPGQPHPNSAISNASPGATSSARSKGCPGNRLPNPNTGL